MTSRRACDDGPMPTYTFGVRSRPNGDMQLVVSVAPRWTRTLLAVGYTLLSLSGDRVGVGLVARAYRAQDRRADRFTLDVPQKQINEFRCWRRAVTSRRRCRWGRRSA